VQVLQCANDIVQEHLHKRHWHYAQIVVLNEECMSAHFTVHAVPAYA
jgi:hypothetical protein